MIKQVFKNKYRKQVKKSHYYFDSYMHEERWISYYHQIVAVRSVAKILRKKTISVLEIGVGDKIVSNLLKSQGMKVVTMDIDPDLHPEHISSLPTIPDRKEGKYDCILCCQVLEHVRYEDVKPSLTSMAQKARYAVVSVPHKGITLSLTLKPWFFKTKKLSLSVPSIFRKHKFDGEHYWELGAKRFSVKRFNESLEKAGFSCSKNYRVPEFPYHHFFILKSQVS